MCEGDSLDRKKAEWTRGWPCRGHPRVWTKGGREEEESMPKRGTGAQNGTLLIFRSDRRFPATGPPATVSTCSSSRSTRSRRKRFWDSVPRTRRSISWIFPWLCFVRFAFSSYSRGRTVPGAGDGDEWGGGQ